MEVMEVNTICKFDCQQKLCKSNYNFYSILRPTVFCLRFFGAPTGLYRCHQRVSKCRQLFSKVAASLILFLVNLGAIYDFVATLRTVSSPLHKFDDKMNLFYALGLNITGAFALDILWWRRRLLRQLLEDIDFESKICDRFDNECQKSMAKEVKINTIKMFLFMWVFTGFTIYSLWESTKRNCINWTDMNFHKENIILIIRCLSVIVFALVLSFYISLSWIFRLKVRRINNFLKRILIEDAKTGIIPDDINTRLIEAFFTSYLIQFKRFELIFKQIAGFFFLVQVWSVLSLAKESITNVLDSKWIDQHNRVLGHEVISCALLAYFLYSISIVEHYLIKLVKLLYHLSLTVRFISDDRQCTTLSKKFKLIGETIDKSGLNLTVFGLLHINRHLMVSTASFLTTYTILMYELSGDKHRPLLIH